MKRFSKLLLLLMLTFLSTYAEAQGVINAKENYCKDILVYKDLILYEKELFRPVIAYCSYFEDSVYFNKAEFNGEMDFRMAYFYPTVYADSSRFGNEITFKGAEFNGYANFNETIYEKLGDFRKASFYKNAYFENLISYNTLNYHSSRFFGKANFINAKFGGQINFGGSDFRKSSSFQKAEYDSMAVFLGSTFRKQANFNNNIFTKNAVFNDVHFYKSTNFNNSIFNKVAYFNSTKFDSLADFSNVKFKDVAIFTNASFGGEVILNGSTLPDTLQFNAITNVANVIDFTEWKLAKGKEVCAIDLVDTKLNKIILDYSNFHLYFAFPDDYTFEQMDKTYIYLLAHQQKHGFEKGFRKLKSEYKKFKRLHGESWLSQNSIMARNLLIVLGLLSIAGWFYYRRKSTKVA